MSYFRANKFGAVRQTYNGYAYHSKKEAEYAAELDLRMKAKDIRGWRRQEKIPLTMYGEHIANYFIDFVIEHNDGSEEYVEVKGFETNEWRLKWKICSAMFKHDFPKRKLTLEKV